MKVKKHRALESCLIMLSKWSVKNLMALDIYLFVGAWKTIAGMMLLCHATYTMGLFRSFRFLTVGLYYSKLL